MRRALSIWFPTLSADAWARRRRRGGAAPDPAPLLLARASPRGRVVAAACARALAAGVRAGMTVSTACAAMGGDAPRVEDLDPEADAADLRALAAWARRLSPIAAVDAPDGLLLDVTGCARVHGGESALARRAVEGLGRLGFGARAAVASTFGCAWAAARFGDHAGGPPVIAPGGEASALAGMPVRALRVEGAVAEALAEVGVETVGQVAGLPRSTLPGRFGPALLLGLDRAVGAVSEVVRAERDRPAALAEVPFEGPTTDAGAVESAARAALGRVCAELRARGRGALRLETLLWRVDADAVVVWTTLGRPSRGKKHLWSLLRPRLERANLGFGVEGVRVRAARTRPLREAQDERWREADAATDAERERALAEALDTLVNRLGAGRVRRARWGGSHIPEHAFRMATLDAPPAGPGDPSGPAQRPTTLFRRPEPVGVTAMSPDGPVASVRWRGVDLRIAHCAGPERIEPEWWLGPPGGARGARRDYFRCRTEGGLCLWVFRASGPGGSSWFVHGVWA